MSKSKKDRFDFGMRFSCKMGGPFDAEWLQSLYSILGPKRQPGFVKKAVRRTHRLMENKRRRQDRLEAKREIRENGL